MQEEPDPLGELVGHPRERGGAVWLTRRVGHAPVDGVGVAGEVGADLAHAVAQRDHVVEPLGREHR